MLNAFDGLTGAVAALAPQEVSGAADVDGITIDKRTLPGNPTYAKFFAQAGAVAGAPTSFSVAARAQHSDDGTNFVEITDPYIMAQTPSTVVAANGIAAVPLYLRGTKRYIRLVVKPAFVAGTSPEVLMSGMLVTGEPGIV